MDNSGNYSGPYNAPPNNKKLQQTQAQVDEVIGIMKINVEKVMERDQKLNELAEHADTLQMGASQFEQHASRLKRKFWWQNLKMMIIIGVVCTSLLIIFLIYMFSSGDDSSSDPHVAPTPAISQKN